MARDKSNTSVRSVISSPMPDTMKDNALEQLSGVIDKRNEVMKRHLLGETRVGTASQGSSCDDLR